MKKTIILLCFLIAVIISGCATEQGSGGGGWGSPSGHQGHHH